MSSRIKENSLLGIYIHKRLPDGTPITVCLNRNGLKINDMEPPIPWQEIEEYRRMLLAGWSKRKKG